MRGHVVAVGAEGRGDLVPRPRSQPEAGDQDDRCGLLSQWWRSSCCCDCWWWAKGCPCRSRSASRPGGASDGGPRSNPAAAKMLRVPMWSSPQVMSVARLGEHRVGLERASPAFAREVDGRPRERVADAAAPESRAGEDAGHRPHARRRSCPRIGPPMGRGRREGGPRTPGAARRRTSRRVRRRGRRPGRSSWSRPSWPQCVCSRSRRARSSAGYDLKASRGASL